MDERADGKPDTYIAHACLKQEAAESIMTPRLTHSSFKRKSTFTYMYIKYELNSPKRPEN